MPLLKDNVAALQISDEVKADIMALLDSISAKETEVETLRQKVPTDSQKVVESVDFQKFEDATKELATLKEQAAEKLRTDAGKGGSSLLSAFPMFFE